MAKVVRCYGMKISYRCPVTKHIHGVFVQPDQLIFNQWEDDWDGYQTIKLDIICKHCGKPHTIALKSEYNDTYDE